MDRERLGRECGVNLAGQISTLKAQRRPPTSNFLPAAAALTPRHATNPHYNCDGLLRYISAAYSTC